MSYEGYEQLLCKVGHQSGVDAMELMYGSATDGKCRLPECDEPIVWRNGVDQTNGCCPKEGTWPAGCHRDEDCESCSMIVELEEATPAEYDECSQCHHRKLIKEETYKIPSDKGRKI